MNLDAKLTADEAARSPLGITRDMIYQWKTRGLIHPIARRGRSPLYRWGDLITVERTTRHSGNSHRRTARHQLTPSQTPAWGGHVPREPQAA